MVLEIVFVFGFLIYRIGCSVKSKEFNVWREVGIWIFFIYLVAVANLTLFKHGVFEFPIYLNRLPFRLNLIPFVETFKMLTDGWVVAYSWYQVIANILVFVPLGFLAPLLFKSLNKWWHILMVGCCGSLLIEGFQILTPQNVVDIDDLIFNTLGAMVGYVVYLIFIKLVKYLNLMKIIEKFEVHLTKSIVKVVMIPFSLMLFLTCLVSVLAYYESTYSANLSDEELVSAYMAYEGDIITRTMGDYRLVLKDYDDYLDLDIYQALPLNRVRRVAGSGWNPEYHKETYNFTFLTDDYRVDNEGVFVIFGKNEEATEIKITYLDEDYTENLSMGNFLVVYPQIINMDNDLYELYDGVKSEKFSVEFLNKDKEVVDSL